MILYIKFYSPMTFFLGHLKTTYVDKILSFLATYLSMVDIFGRIFFSVVKEDLIVAENLPTV